jgi:hypothetical protein
MGSVIAVGRRVFLAGKRSFAMFILEEHRIRWVTGGLWKKRSGLCWGEGSSCRGGFAHFEDWQPQRGRIIQMTWVLGVSEKDATPQL